MCELPCLVRLIRRHTRRRPAPFLTSSVIKFHFERSTRRGKEEGTRGAAWTRDRDFHTVVTRGKTTEVLPLITSPTIDSTPPTSPPPDLLLSFYRLSLYAQRNESLSLEEREIFDIHLSTREHVRSEIYRSKKYLSVRWRRGNRKRERRVIPCGGKEARTLNYRK